MSNFNTDFDKVYETKRWGKNILSGPGSSIKETRGIIEPIINIINEKKIKKIIDGSCGDCNWIMEVLKKCPDVEYIGTDISKYIININKKKFKNVKNVSFHFKNYLQEDVEKCDLFIFRHTMMHLKDDVNLSILDNIKKNAKYALLTSHLHVKKNPSNNERISLVKGSNNDAFCWMYTNMNIPPYNLNKFILKKIKETTKNKDEFLNLYLFNSTYDYDEFKNLENLKKINAIVKSTNEKLEGNCMYEHHSDFKELVNYRGEQMDIKRKNIFKLSKISKNILEIGFNAGHSALLYFYSNPNIKLLSFDICSHIYTQKCVNYINEIYDIEFVKGDSTKTLQLYNRKDLYDIIHIDGGHGVNVAEKDLVNCLNFSHKNTFLIFDDTQHIPLNQLLNKYVEKNIIYEIDYEKFNLEKSFFHRIFRYSFS